MIFTSLTYGWFLAAVFCLYWLCRTRNWQNAILLAASYFFYGYIHPWFCLLVITSTLVDFSSGLGMARWPSRRKLFLLTSLGINLGLLGVFKYFNFFVSEVQEVLRLFGWPASIETLNILMPVGISFYTFQTLSYTIDVYRGRLKPCNRLIDYACFVASFPQILSGPIERAGHFLPQIEKVREWSWPRFYSVWPLLLTGYMKKLVIADNIAVYVDKIFMLSHPSWFILFVGGVGFSIQLLCDFSAYTDIARATGRLLGLELVVNFKAPYLAITPSDFWRRWHISLSSWIRDYVYISLGGSRVGSKMRLLFILMTTMTLCGLWHGARWNYIAWGAYHGVLLSIYHFMGWGGRWRPKSAFSAFLAWLTMQCGVLFGWLLFRSPSVSYLLQAFSHPILGLGGQDFLAGIVVLLTVFAYSLPWLILSLLEARAAERYWLKTAYRWVQLGIIALLANPAPQQFIYFQF